MVINSFYKELKRRNVLKAVLAYIVFSWIIIQVASILFPTFNISQFWLQFLVIALIIGLGIWVLISWHYEIGPNGIRKTKPLELSDSGSIGTKYYVNYMVLWFLVIVLVAISLIFYYEVLPNKNQSLQEASVIPNLEPEKSVAVLAFLDLSPAKDHEYFSDGISEEILNYLSKNPDLVVISRTSSFSFKGKDNDVKTIGQQLNASYILEGSVRQAGSNLRITAQLIRADNGVHLWSETYQRKMEDIFDIQVEIAQEVANKLKVTLLGDKIQETDPEAYTKYLQAKNLSLRFNRESSETGLAVIDQSLQIDSTYAPAWLLKSKLHFQIRVYGNSEVALKESEKAAEKAVSLNPQYAEAYAWLGRFNVMNSNFEAARTSFQKALSINPENSEVLRHVSAYPTLSLEDRILLLQKAIKIDPLDPGNYRMQAVYHFCEGQFQIALDAMETYNLYQPYGGADHGLRAEILAWLGRKEEALNEVLKEEDEFSRTYSEVMTSLVLKLEGAAEKVEEKKHFFVEEQPYLLAQMYAYLDNKKQAYALLENALNANDYDMYFQIKNDPYMFKLKNDQRFKDLLKKIEIPKDLELKLKFK